MAAGYDPPEDRGRSIGASMATIQIHAGDFGKGKATLMMGVITFAWQAGDGWVGSSLLLKDIESVDIATEESVKRIGGAVGWGVVGGALLGPVGLLAGLLAGGRSKDITFVAKTKEGKKFLGTTDSASFKKIAAAAF